MGAKAELRCCTLIGAGANAAEEPIRAADRTETSFMVGLLAECEGQEVRVGLWREQPPKRRFACVFVGGNYVAKLKFNYTKTPKYIRHRMTEGRLSTHRSIGNQSELSRKKIH